MGENDQKDTKRTAGDEGQTERRYTVDELATAARVLIGSDASPHAVRGALATIDRKTHTVEQAQAAVKQFKKREVS